jgi:hypothetical protein
MRAKANGDSTKADILVSNIARGECLTPWARLRKSRACRVSVVGFHFETPVTMPQCPQLEGPCVHNRPQVETSQDAAFHFEMTEPLFGILAREHDTSR